MSEQLEFELGPLPEEPRPQPASQRQVPLNLLVGTQLHAAADVLHRELSEATGVALQLRITNNSSTMMSLRYAPDGTTARLSLHHMFLNSNSEVREALAAWVKKPQARKAGGVLDTFIKEQSHRIAPARRRAVLHHARGKVHDLRRYFRELNQEYFDDSITAAIVWGKMPRLRRRRSIRFGSYAPQENMIRMHPLLDQEFVPEFFVRYIVFHEMLHAHLGIEESENGRRGIHTREFKRQESTYADYGRALAWMREPRNLERFLRAARTR